MVLDSWSPGWILTFIFRLGVKFALFLEKWISSCVSITGFFFLFLHFNKVQDAAVSFKGGKHTCRNSLIKSRKAIRKFVFLCLCFSCQDGLFHFFPCDHYFKNIKFSPCINFIAASLFKSRDFVRAVKCECEIKK